MNNQKENLNRTTVDEADNTLRFATAMNTQKKIL
jgi:hypothetical protein